MGSEQDTTTSSRLSQAHLYQKVFKRFFDMTISAVLLVSLSWLFLFIALGYLLTLNTPIIFIQERIGKNEKSFRMIKFRTLRNSTATLQDRRFRFGDFLRFTSLDEVPQLWHVLKGEMSLIGPRPLPVAYLPLFSETQRLRHVVRPGITGLAQVNGRHAISWKAKFEFDIHYVKNVSLLLDLGIAVKTLLLILSLRKDNSLNESPFRGDK
jgi:undecaprenyl phosphate N,N'-diacetylbacillosamine 1-phosphate transferase